MLLKITITYFDGRSRDVLHHTGLTLEEARARLENILAIIQNCIEENKIFYAGDNDRMTAFGPQLLASAHFKSEIVEEDPPA